MSTRLVSLQGLGFGDCGKGLFTDFLARHWDVHTVVRFNGGAQAGHNVVLPDGRHHTFSQFGSATLIPAVYSVLAAPVLVHPGALMVEHAHLMQLGVPDALQRLLIDGRCRITTPFHQAAGRLRELQRGTNAHGTCGAGVGETVRHSLDQPGQVLRYADLQHPTRTLTRLKALQHSLHTEFEPARRGASAAMQTELDLLADEHVALRWLMQCQALLAQCPPASAAQISQRLHRPGTVLFEGAQGLLLDEWHGFHPHTTWSSTHALAAAAVARDAGWRGPMTHYGVLRSYLTRHGPGPLPTHDADLDALAEPHNDSTGWQGAFRRGHPDGVLLRYALAHAGPLNGLLVSHLDAFDRTPALKWCDAYRTATAAPAHAKVLRALPLCDGPALQRQQDLTRMLTCAKPVYDHAPLRSAKACVAKLQAVSGLPVLFGSYGPTHANVAPL